MDESAVQSLVWQQPPSQYKPLPSQLIAQQEEMDEDRDATLLMADNLTTLKTLSPSQKTYVKKKKCNMQLSK
jgi:hypothetical protein